MSNIDKRIESLRPEAQNICFAWKDYCDRLMLSHSYRTFTKCEVIVTETLRSRERQAELLAAHKSSIQHSKHEDGLAWDFVVIYNGIVISDGADWRYTLCGLIGKVLGCKWPTHLASGMLDAGHLEILT